MSPLLWHYAIQIFHINFEAQKRDFTVRLCSQSKPKFPSWLFLPTNVVESNHKNVFHQTRLIIIPCNYTYFSQLMIYLYITMICHIDVRITNGQRKCSFTICFDFNNFVLLYYTSRSGDIIPELSYSFVSRILRKLFTIMAPDAVTWLVKTNGISADVPGAHLSATDIITILMNLRYYYSIKSLPYSAQWYISWMSRSRIPHITVRHVMVHGNDLEWSILRYVTVQNMTVGNFFFTGPRESIISYSKILQ